MIIINIILSSTDLNIYQLQIYNIYNKFDTFSCLALVVIWKILKKILFENTIKHILIKNFNIYHLI